MKRVPGRLWIWLAALLMAVAVSPGFARSDLHEASVPVADRSAEARTAAVQAALADVLARLTGDPEIAAKPVGKSLLRDPSRYLQQYQYEGGGAAELYLRAGFAAAPLEAALRQQGLSLWGRERPEVLVWIAVDDGRKRYLLGAEDTADPLLAELQTAARRQDLQLVLPLLDLEDQSKVTLTGIGEGDLDALAEASARYQPGTVLLGGLRASGDGWQARWALRHAGRDARWESAAASLPALLDQSLAPAAEKLATRAPAAATDAPPARLLVRIEGVMGLRDYARVDQYVRGLPPVRRADLLAAQGQRVDYAVEVQGGAAGWAQAVAAGGILDPVAAVAADSANANAPALPEAAVDAAGGAAPGVLGAPSVYRLRP